MYGLKDKVIRLRVDEDDIKLLDEIIAHEKTLHHTNRYDGTYNGLLRSWDNVNQSAIIRSLINKYYEEVVKKDK